MGGTGKKAKARGTPMRGPTPDLGKAPPDGRTPAQAQAPAQGKPPAGGPTPGEEPPAADVRPFIERGLERYRRGELREAIVEWEQGLALDPQNSEAGNLIAYLRELMTPAGAAEGKPERVVHSTGWPDDEKTEPESPQETRQRVLRAESEAALAQEAEKTRRGKMTVESPISAFLAPITSPEWKPPLAVEDGAPEAPVLDEISEVRSTTGPAVERRTGPPRRISTVITDTVREQPGKIARLRASEFIQRCKSELGNGQWAAAAVAAEGALGEADRVGEAAVAEVLNPARPQFEQAFMAHLGPLQKVPVSLSSAEAPDVRRLGPHAQAILNDVDGLSSMEQLATKSAVGRLECLRALSGLLRVGAIKLM